MAIFTYAAAFSSGAGSHVFLFSKGEWDRKAPRILLVHILLCTSIFLAFALIADRSLAMCFLETFRVSSSFASGLFTSTLAYRLFFHPLRSFPGPLAACVSSFWAFKKQWPDLRFYVKLQSIHDTYGDFVRIREVIGYRSRTKS